MIIDNLLVMGKCVSKNNIVVVRKGKNAHNKAGLDGSNDEKPKKPTENLSEDATASNNAPEKIVL